MPDTAHDPGGRVTHRLPAGVVGVARYGGPRQEYRYQVRYYIPELAGGRALGVIMMNPSTATEQCMDPTVAKCWRAAGRLGFSELLVGNVFAYRATDQRRLAEVTDPVGWSNDAGLQNIAAMADAIVLAYGTPQIAALRPRGTAVARHLAAAGRRLHVFALSKAGRPCHPLYLPEPLKLMPWEPPHD
jgi:hypothetical protein